MSGQSLRHDEPPKWSASEPNRIPSITLPRGGGALRSIDEKFSVNAANGTCEISIPLPFSKTRSGLNSAATLLYNSGSGNSAFGLGWSLNLPSIHRRTDRHLPRYEDAFESDVFLFSGAEDLVPAFNQNDKGNWVRDEISDGNLRVERYRPRIEGMFARIEKITIAREAGFYWKVTTRDNVVTIFGRTTAARITDPNDTARIFRWLPEWTYDDKGNCVEFVYKDEDRSNIPDEVEERNRRSGLAVFVNKHLKRIRYGNRNSYSADPDQPFQPALPADLGYFYEAVLDYGEHDSAAPSPGEIHLWPCRFDPFSDYRAGFEIRTYRLCRRILFFSTFAELDIAPAPQPVPCLTRSLDFEYQHFHFDGAPHQSQEADFIKAIGRVHYRKTAPQAYQSKRLPALEFTYHELAWNKAVETVSTEDVVNAPSGASSGYQWLDLYGEGVPGILTEQAAGWFYKSNLGAGHFSRAAAVAPKPSLAGITAKDLQFHDLNADGGKHLVSLRDGLKGYFELTDDKEWLPFREFKQTPVVNFNDSNALFIDLDGDGKPDLLVSEEAVFRWYPSLGTQGYDWPQLASRALDEERGPAIKFADGTQTIFLADMNGDGLSDIVRVRNSEVCYWPNLGFGRFGAKVSMRNAPCFDHPEHFDPRAIQLADISGTGAADLLYLGQGGCTAWINLSGNAWSEPQSIDPFPGTERPNRVEVLDLLGNGTASLVWSSELPANAAAPIRYVDLMGGRKPYVMSGYKNNLGLEARLEYKSSSTYALLDKREGRPWATKLPFPTMCVSRMEMRDSVSGSLMVHQYRYRHGYYDHAEREFRGFGMVEEIDSETFEHFSKSGASNVIDSTVHQPPIRTRTWYHTGAFINGTGMLRQFQEEYFKNAVIAEYQLPDAVIQADELAPEELRQAARACKGMVLRREVYADDGSSVSANPYFAAEHNCYLRLIQPMLGNRFAVFLVHESEAVTYHYERHPQDPRIAHELNTVIDQLGNVVESASVVYGRGARDATLPEDVQIEQGRTQITYTVHRYTNDVTENAAYRLRCPCETRVFELTGAQPMHIYFTPTEVRAAFLGAAPLAYEDTPRADLVERRNTHHQRVLFARDTDINLPLPLGTLGSLGLHYEDYGLAFTQTLLRSLYDSKATEPMLREGKYVKGDDYKARGLFPASDADGCWWAGSGILQYPTNPEQHFYLPNRYIDPSGSTTRVRYYSDYHLLIDQIEDDLGNQTNVEKFDFRFPEPQSVKDINDNIVDVSFDLFGLVTGTAMRGKGNEADDLVGFDADLTPAQVVAFLLDPVANGAALLQHATSRFVYSLDIVPAVAASITRETHHQSEVASGKASPLQYAFQYSDGLGRVAMHKIQAEPGLASRIELHTDGTYKITEVDTTPNRRWVGSGRTVVNNKGNPVMQFEPYFSVTHAYESAKELVESGVTPILYYDPLDRLIRTDFPDGTFSRVLFDVWQQSSYDRNDNVQASAWYRARKDGRLGAAEERAAKKSLIHDDTPVIAHYDSLGRAIYTLEHNRFRDRVTDTISEEFLATLVKLDIDGNRLFIRDPRRLDVMVSAYDMLKRAGHATSMDRDERWMLNDARAKPLYGWDGKGNRFHTVYDALHRPTQREMLTSAAVLLVYEKLAYGSDKTKNQNGKLITSHDGSGVVANAGFDFKGNLLETSRTFTVDYTKDVDWSDPAAVALQAHTFTTTSQYDALNRPISTTTPDGSVIVPQYSEANLLTKITGAIRGGASQSFINKIEHDQKGQRQRIEYGNGAVTRFTYDDQTFRVRRIQTTRITDGAILQDLNYTYDPVGNITLISDLAQQKIFFNNQIILPDNDFTYDALYRLISATGREQIAGNAPVSQFDEFRTHLPHPANGKEVQNYRQQYDYDQAGNLINMVHHAGLGTFLNQWTRHFVPSDTNNQLNRSEVSGVTEKYEYDVHGNLTGPPGHALYNWDFSDYLRSVDLGGGGTAYYTYDAGGIRARKVVERLGGLVEERLYIGAFEVFTRTQGGTLKLGRETLHVSDVSHRLAMIDSRVAGTDGTAAQLIRYQFSNHLGTAALELDDGAQIISYEEYYPFGSTSFQSVDSTREVPAKRYRYTGKERDEETGFYYYGARYYAPWLARWTSADPEGLIDGNNLYAYVHQNPIALVDLEGTDASGPEQQKVSTEEAAAIKKQYEAKGSYKEQRAFLMTLSSAQQQSIHGKASATVSATFNRIETQHQPNWWLMEDLASSTVIGAALVAGGLGPGPIAYATGLAQKGFALYGAFGLGVETGQLITGTDLAGHKLTEKETARLGFHVVSGFASFGLGLALNIGGGTSSSGPLRLNESSGALTAQFVRVKGQVTVPATPAEAALFRRSMKIKREILQVDLGGKLRNRTGSRTSVAITDPVNEIGSTLHTHPSGKVAMFSTQDVGAYRGIHPGGRRFAPETTHGVLGDKWPMTRRDLASDGFEPPPIDVVKTVIEQSMLTSENLSIGRLRFPFVPPGRGR
ncbi:MAG: SpvB/TcaC N-terminal domain-containing protein [Blastocatellia bacterium]